VYLPLLWEPMFCWRTPLTLGYTRGHFSALVPMEADLCAHLGARANIDTNDDAPTVYLPLMDYDGKILPVHFLQPSEVTGTAALRQQCSCVGGVTKKLCVSSNNRMAHLLLLLLLV